MPGQRLLRTGLERQYTRCSDSLASSDCKEAILLPRAAGRDALQKTYVKSYCSSSFLLDRLLGFALAEGERASTRRQRRSQSSKRNMHGILQPCSLVVEWSAWQRTPVQAGRKGQESSQGRRNEHWEPFWPRAGAEHSRASFVMRH